MTTIDYSRGHGSRTARPSRQGGRTRSVLLACGVVSALLYAAMIAFVPMLWTSYDSASRTVSELSAIGAPTRPLWELLCIPYVLLAIGFGAAAFGLRFRLLSVASLVIVLAFGVLTFLDAPGVSANRPTPWIGVWERINIGVFLLWEVALAITLLRVREGAARDADPAAPTYELAR